MVTCFGDTTAVLQKAFQYLKPGGWIELYDPIGQMYYDGDPGQDPAWTRWVTAFRKALTAMGRDPDKATHYEEWMKQAGFMDTTETIIPCPASPWPKDEKSKKIGMFSRADFRAFFKGASKLAAAAGLTADEVKQLGEQCMKELDDEKVPVYAK